MHLDDGDPYRGRFAPIPSGVRAIAIGWLDATHQYPVGSVEPEFTARLFEACRVHAVARTRGWHSCTLCPTTGPYPTTATLSDQSMPLGDAEVRLLARDGTWLVAPILHYVTDHGYQPPQEFIEAVTSGRFAPACLGTVAVEGRRLAECSAMHPGEPTLRLFHEPDFDSRTMGSRFAVSLTSLPGHPL